MRTPAAYIRQTRELYDQLGYEPYRWLQADGAPAFSPAPPLAESKLGLIVSSGAYVKGQVAFHYKDDTSIRSIPRGTPVDQLRFSHVTENYLPEARLDPRCVVPIEALAALEADGTIGSLAENFYSCMGGVYSQRRVTDELIPTLEATIARERLDLLLLVPL